ncbi:hypothetical protein PR048_012096 [Dryococelus australis]|uniref:Uncharacterized protein n=1 Tax=Dryococelus australis TaxID=614101 RepID=A0ABQ9HNM0_9NEOP|nr:hypothetical protein PR048_012096 [Dryococelus australis]
MLPRCTYSVISVDLQQVIPLPTLTHTNMYHSRQLNCYNFGIHPADNDVASMNVRHEAMASRGSNEIASYIFNLVHMGKFCRYKLMQQKFVLKGHSFLNCDRIFAHIEKHKAKTQCLTPDDVMLGLSSQ